MKKLLLTGLIVLLPFTITVILVVVIVNALTNPFLDGMKDLLQTLSGGPQFFKDHPVLLLTLTRIVILVCLVIVTFFIGSLGRIFVVRSFLQKIERSLNKIPFFKTIYKTAKQVMQTLVSSRKSSFKSVVLVPFPHKNQYSLGLVPGDVSAACQAQSAEELVSVLIPSSPNPITGFILMFKKSDVYFIDMKVEDALKFIISCGVLSQK